MARPTFVALLLLVSHPASAQSGGADLTPSTWQTKYASARIESLEQRIALGNRCTEDFWQEMKRLGTPLARDASVIQAAIARAIAIPKSVEED
jgi:hypothetical protein